MKAQMFVVTMIFLAGLIFFVQQALFGYTALDLTEPFEADEFYTNENVRDIVDEIIEGSATPEEANEKILEFTDFVKAEVVKRGYELKLDYLLDISQPFPPGAPVCSDGAIEGTEVCECGIDSVCGNLDDDVAGETCITQGYASGDLFCSGDCLSFDTSSCVPAGPVCGDGNPEGGEGCDDGDQDNSDACPDGVGGTCQPATCGDGFIWNTDGGTEVCDGTDLGDETCESQLGFGYSGTLACSGDCLSFDTSGCVPIVELTGCTNIISSGIYHLTANITDSSSSYCMNISANDVVLDCQGNMIDGNNIADYGIYIYRSIFFTDTNITIRNCTVSDWDGAGIYSYYADSNRFENLNISDNSRGLYLRMSNTNTFIDIIANNNGIAFSLDISDEGNFTNIIANNNVQGLYFSSSDSNSLTNITANGNYYHGIFFQSSGSNILTNSNLINNSEYDFYIAGPDCNNGLVNVTGTDNKPIVYYNYPVNLQNWDNNVSEIILCNADNSVLNNITMKHTDKKNNGIILSNVDNSNFIDIKVSDSYRGFYIYRSDSNSFTNITANGNYRGLYFDESSYNNLTNSRIENNTYGIQLDQAGEDGANLIYNNFFNNTVNVYFRTTIHENYWNTSYQPGTNIIGGSWIGGNYWTNPTGTGFSDNCADSGGDGICDNAYDVENDVSCTPGVDCSSNTDYLPLK